MFEQDQLVFGNSHVFRSLVEKADKFANSELPVLLQGETGVGKERLAQRIHQRSSRRNRPFVAVNCAAIPESLFESELFGYAKGAFSGAVHNYGGLIKSAHQGTLFLDEIGELSLNVQSKLLRVLENAEVRPVGSQQSTRVDVRFIAATNQALAIAVSERKFRLDLLQRLGVLPLSIPALRERLEDLPLIVCHLCTRLGIRFTPNILPLFAKYDWPGNIRQLKSVIARAGVLSDGQLLPTIVSEIMQEERTATLALSPQAPCLSSGTLADIERHVILERLEKCHGNRRKTAAQLGISKSSLHDKLRRWRCEPGDIPICAQPIRTASAGNSASCVGI